MKFLLFHPFFWILALISLAFSSVLPAMAPTPAPFTIDAASGGKLILTDFYPGPLPSTTNLAAIPDLSSLKLTPDEVGYSYQYFRANFDLIRNHGLDGIIYVADGQPVSAALPVALKDAQIKATVLLDLNTLHPLSARKVPSEIRRHTESLAAAAMAFFNSLPRECRAFDASRRLPVFVRGFPEDIEILPEKGQDIFFVDLIERFERMLDSPIRFYWLSPVSSGVLRASLAFEEVRTINSMLHTPHYPQTDALSVHLFFDERFTPPAGTLEPFLPRVQYQLHRLKQALWLAQQQQCRIIRFAGWNAFADGTNLAPDLAWRTQKMEMAAAFVQSARGITRTDIAPARITVRRLDSSDTPDPVELARKARWFPFADVALAELNRRDSARVSSGILSSSQEITNGEDPFYAVAEEECDDIFLPVTKGDPCQPESSGIPEAELSLSFQLVTSATVFSRISGDEGLRIFTNTTLLPITLPLSGANRSCHAWTRLGQKLEAKPEQSFILPPGAVAESRPD